MRYRETVTGGFLTKVVRKTESRSSCSASFANTRNTDSWTGTLTKKSILDACTPGYHQVKTAGGFLPINPCIIETRVEKRIPGNGEFTLTSGGCVKSKDSGPFWSDNGLLLPSDPSPAIIQDMLNTAIADARGSVLDALTTAAEAGKTSRLVQSGFNRLMNFAEYLAYKARRLRNRRESPMETFSNLWLEYRYGWMPIVYSVQDGLAAYQDQIANGQMANGGARFEDSLNQTTVQTLPDAYGTVTITKVLQGSRKYSGFAYAKVTSSAGRKAGVDPILTTWELIPFSFVADWFININAYLQAASPFSQGTMLGSGSSVKDQYTSTTSVAYSWNLNGGSGSFTGLQHIVEVERYTRGSGGAALPTLNPRLNPSRVLDLSALLYGRLRAWRRLLT